jgi:DNA-binding beta-propeller fold protein YncE
MGILYDNVTNKVFVALSWNRSIAVVDVSTMNITIYPMPWQIDENYYGPLPYIIAETPDGYIWFSISGCMVTPNMPPANIPSVGVLDYANNIVYIYYLPAALGFNCDIKFSNNYIWFLGVNGLAKIDYITKELVETHIISVRRGLLEPDSDSIWISFTEDGFIARFNTTSDNFDANITGFSKPAGIYADSKYLYVAENTEYVLHKTVYGTIAKVDKATFQITRINTTAVIIRSGPVYVLKDASGNLWWTDNSNHVGVMMAFTGLMYVYNAISPYCRLMTEVPSSGIWFSAVGSAYVAIAHSPYKSVDINGDGKVSLADLVILAKAYSSKEGDVNWDSRCDIDNNGVVGLSDLVMLAKGYGKER